jgi:hypothetical protein
MADLIRAEDPDSGHQFSTSAAYAKAKGLKVLGKPATDRFGRTLPAVYRTDKAGKPTTKQTPKES